MSDERGVAAGRRSGHRPHGRDACGCRHIPRRRWRHPAGLVCCPCFGQWRLRRAVARNRRILGQARRKGHDWSFGGARPRRRRGGGSVCCAWCGRPRRPVRRCRRPRIRGFLSISRSVARTVRRAVSVLGQEDRGPSDGHAGMDDEAQAPRRQVSARAVLRARIRLGTDALGQGLEPHHSERAGIPGVDGHPRYQRRNLRPHSRMAQPLFESVQIRAGPTVFARL